MDRNKQRLKKQNKKTTKTTRYLIRQYNILIFDKIKVQNKIDQNYRKKEVTYFIVLSH